jgi:hypothetical protein
VNANSLDHVFSPPRGSAGGIMAASRTGGKHRIFRTGAANRLISLFF